MQIRTEEDMTEAAARMAQKYNCAVLLKGGHQIQEANDFLFTDSVSRWFRGRHIDNPNTHGTGCTLSSAIAAHLARGCDLPTSIERAKSYISGALEAGLALGAGSGPLHHGFVLEDR